MNVRRFLGGNRPNVKSLSREGDIDALIESASFREVVRRVDGRLSDTGVPVREQAVLALSEHDGDRAAKTLHDALNDPSDRVRCAAVLGLYERGDTQALAKAAAHLRDEDGQALALAFRALLELEHQGSTRALAMEILERAGDRPVGEIDGSFLRALLETEEPEAADDVVEGLIPALASHREPVADRAEDLLELFAPESVDHLIAELATGAAPHRAASVLGRIRDARALDPLAAALAHPEPMVRMESCVALGELRDPAATEPLLRATRDSEHIVRAGAGAALDRIGTAAIAVSVATLLRPLLQAAPGETTRALEQETGVLLEAGEPEEPDGVTILRRFARFIERVEDARAGAPRHAFRRPAVGRPLGASASHGAARAVSTPTGNGRAISLPRQTNGDARANGTPSRIQWPASAGKSSAST